MQSLQLRLNYTNNQGVDVLITAGKTTLSTMHSISKFFFHFNKLHWHPLGFVFIIELPSPPQPKLWKLQWPPKSMMSSLLYKPTLNIFPPDINICEKGSVISIIIRTNLRRIKCNPPFYLFNNQPLIHQKGFFLVIPCFQALFCFLHLKIHWFIFSINSLLSNILQ